MQERDRRGMKGTWKRKWARTESREINEINVLRTKGNKKGKSENFLFGLFAKYEILLY